jgi:hypothetical protein
MAPGPEAALRAGQALLIGLTGSIGHDPADSLADSRLILEVFVEEGFSNQELLARLALSDFSPKTPVQYGK